jgi:protein arginine kinase
MLKTFLNRPADWIAQSGPEEDCVIHTQATLVRNLADFPFPERCSEDEKAAVEERVLAALDQSEVFASGQYFPISELNLQETRLLMERHLMSPWLAEGQGARGVFLSEDQCLSVMVNERDHVRITALASGLKALDAWTRLSEADDALALTLDFSFDEKQGYLSSSLDELGTGLRVSGLVHLPGLTLAGRIMPLEQSVRKNHHSLTGAYGEIGKAPGYLYVVGNRGTLGRSEEEIVYHFRTAVGDAVSQERDARASIMKEESLPALADRVGRALGIARGARVLEFQEALDLLSALRLGAATGQIESISVQQLNELLVLAQSAHIESRLGEESDHLALSTARASLFRQRFS